MESMVLLHHLKVILTGSVHIRSFSCLPLSFRINSLSINGIELAIRSVMAAIPVKHPMSEDSSQDRAQRALQVAVVSGFIANWWSVQETCLGLCNAWRDGVPVGGFRIARGMPSTLLAMVVPDMSTAAVDKTITTRVLHPRRVLRLELDFSKDATEGSGLIPDGWVPDDGPNMEQVDLTNVRWPDGVKDVQLFVFNKTVEGMAWPQGLQRLSFHLHDLPFLGPSDVFFHGAFNQPLHGASFPSGLREIFLGSAFDQDIGEVVWPELLERLSLPGFNKPIDNVNWPPRLLALEFQTPAQISLRREEVVRGHDVDLNMEGFNHPLTNLPASLETLWLSDGFTRSLEDVTWPNGLKTLGIGAPIVEGDISWPSTLKHIYSRYAIVRSVPPGCVVTVVKEYDSEEEDDFEDVMDAYLDFHGPRLGGGEYEYCEDDY